MARSPTPPDMLGLEAFALEQGGYFDRADAHRHGFSDRLIHYHIRAGRFERAAPGVYRLHVAPIGTDDEYLLAWVWTNYRGAVSHESALALYSLSDVSPARVHITVPSPFRRTTAPFVQVHHAPLPEHDVRPYHGLQVTTPARAIADAAASGTDPRQVHRAVRQALDRGLVDAAALRAAAGRHGNQYRRNVRQLIEEAMANAEA